MMLKQSSQQSRHCQLFDIVLNCPSFRYYQMLFVSCHHNVFLISSICSYLAFTLIYTLASLILYTTVTFIDNDIYTKYFKKELSFIEYVNIFDSLSLLLFGIGLWYKCCVPIWCVTISHCISRHINSYTKGESHHYITITLAIWIHAWVMITY